MNLLYLFSGISNQSNKIFRRKDNSSCLSMNFIIHIDNRVDKICFRFSKTIKIRKHEKMENNEHFPHKNSSLTNKQVDI